ncbi:M36 family metallopeptidase [Demetria terragena]|uniref:M36 family metallopeptidase n=1 Tax=Demetria terragena TaxID=63959 RepID=UPI00035E6C7B|nr:M36 family metallopeptidase [Demetria terragena]
MKRSRVVRGALVGASSASLVATLGLPQLTADAAPPESKPAKASHEHDHGLPNFDKRPTVKPSAARTAQARSVTAKSALDARWSRFGTPAAVVAPSGKSLASGLSANPEKAARAYLTKAADTYGLRASDVETMELVNINPVGDTKVVLLRQTFDGVPAGRDGMVTVGVRDGSVVYVGSTLAPTDSTKAKRAPAAASLSHADALAAAAKNVGHAAGKVTERSVGAAATRAQAKPGVTTWKHFSAKKLSARDQRVAKVAIPVPGQAPRMAYHVETSLPGDEGGYAVYIDAVTGEAIARDNLVSSDSDNPTWKVFTGTPNTGDDAGERKLWCWTEKEGCDETQSGISPEAWDVDPATGKSTSTTMGNNAETEVDWGGDSEVGPAEKRSDRNYTYEFTNQWTKSKCDPAGYDSPTKHDKDAAAGNLFAMHNRMHDWSYKLGFTETAWNMQKDNGDKGGLGGDPEGGVAQAGAKSGLRNNANQGTGADGGSPGSNMYMWQPIAGVSYSKCSDGSYDMSVIGHEYGHAISNRMIGGPNEGLSSLHGSMMGESWSDLMATEYLQEFGYSKLGSASTPMGSFVTNNAQRGIRNYNFSKSPLNFSNIGYDLAGVSTHSDGEIWSATMWDIRTAMMKAHGTGNATTQRSCATGATKVEECPGNRQWMQLIFDAWLLKPTGDVSMLDMRDAMLAADMLRFGGANQKLLWTAFAARGFGESASVANTDDDQPRPGFDSPHAKNATLRFSPLDSDGRLIEGAQLFVGDYTARTTPVADTDPKTALGDTYTAAPGEVTYQVVAPGYGQHESSSTIKAGQTRDLNVRLPRNLSSAAAGAAIDGPGDKPEALIDDSEATWSMVTTDGASRPSFVIDLAGGRQAVSRAQLSGLADRPGAPVHRYEAPRQFAISTCDARGKITCSEPADFRKVYTSPKNAFPGGAFRPVAPELNLRSFSFSKVNATHVKVDVLESQCTGNPLYAGEQDNDPENDTDCETASPSAGNHLLTEVQLFTK